MSGVGVALLALLLVTLLAIGAMVFGLVRAVNTADKGKRQRALIGVFGLAFVLVAVGIAVAVVVRAAS